MCLVLKKHSGRKQKEKPHTVISHFIHHHIQLCVFLNFRRSSQFQKNYLRHIASVSLCRLRCFPAFFLKPKHILFCLGVNKRNMWSNIFYISGIDTQRPLPTPATPQSKTQKPHDANREWWLTLLSIQRNNRVCLWSPMQIQSPSLQITPLVMK